MKEFGTLSKRIINSIDKFFGDNFKNLDKEKYVTILRETPFCELEDNPEKYLSQKLEEAEKILQISAVPCRCNIFRTGINITKLGKPRLNQQDELQSRLELMSLMAGRALLGYEEEVDLSVFQCRNEYGELDSYFRLSTGEEKEERLCSITKGVYSQVTTTPFEDELRIYPNTLYATISVPFFDSKQEEHNPKKEERQMSNWVDTLLHILPGNTSYKATVKIEPMSEEDVTHLSDNISQLQELSNELKLYSEFEWSESTNVGGSYTRPKHILQKLGDEARKIKEGAVLSKTENVNGNFGETLGKTFHQKNKEAELTLQKIEQRIYRMTKAKERKAWKVLFCVEAEDEDTLQIVCSSITGTLKKDNYVVDWREKSDLGAFSSILSGDELLPLLRFPTKEFCGFEFSENEEFSLVSPAASSNGLNVGNILWNGQQINKFCLPEAALNRHAFICGMTGSGKTNTVFKLLETASVPFMVIEPVKGEYRALINRYKDLQVYSMKVGSGSDNNLSILRINPFWFPENTNIAFHVDSIKTIIASAFEMSNAMPNILEQCMYSIYIKAGWNIITGKNQYAGTIPDELLYPTFADLLAEIEYYLDHSKFVGETLGDYHGAMTTRLKSFVNSYKGLLLNTIEHPDYGQMMNSRSVIELEGLADDSDKCLVMGTILVQYFEYLKANFQSSSQKLKHILVIEEAHRLFKNKEKQTISSNEGTAADPTGQLVESLSNMMAEIRAFGEGLLIVDQSPTKIAEDVIKNSSTKIIHRIDNEKDIKIVQSSLLMPDDKISIPSLSQGQTIIRTEGMVRPCKVAVYCSDIKESYKLSDSFSNTISHHSEMEAAFAAMAVLSDDVIADEVRSAIWCLLLCMERDGLQGWKELMDTFFMDIIKILKKNRKYDLVNGDAEIIYQIVKSSIRQLGAKSITSIAINEMGALLLFVRRLFEFYEDACNDIPINNGNIVMLENFYVKHLSFITKEHAFSIAVEEQD